MRAQVATFAGWPMPSQFVRRQAPKKITHQIYDGKCSINYSHIIFLFYFEIIIIMLSETV
jgi:hypothetical protein